MRALVFMNDLSGGGAQLGLAEALQRGFLKGFNVSVLALVKGDGKAVDAMRATGHQVHIMYDVPKRKPWHFLGALLTFPLWLARLRPQVVVLSLLQANLVGRFWAHVQPRVSWVVFEHNTRFKKSIAPYLLWLLSWPIKARLADCIETLDAMDGFQIGAKARKKLIVPLVVVESAIKRKASYKAGKIFRLVSAGRLAAVKNFGLVLQAMQGLDEIGIKASYTIFGEGEDKAKLQAQAQACGVADRLELKGFLADWQERLEAYDVYLQPSLYEGLCITNVQAMARGMPVIASPVGGVRSYGLQGKTYLPVSPSSVKGLIEQIKTLAADTSLREGMGRAAAKRIQDLFGQRKAAEVLAKTNRQLVVLAGKVNE